MIEDALIDIMINNGAGAVGMVLMYLIASKKINTITNCPYMQIRQMEQRQQKSI